MSRPLVGTVSGTIRRGRPGATIGIPVAGKSVPMTSSCPPGTTVTEATPDTDIALQYKEIQRLMARAHEREEELPSLVIEESLLSIYSYDELKKEAVCKVTNTNLSGLNSVNDTRMGVTANATLCATCHKDNIECPGHLGMIEFHHPLYHPLFLRNIIQVLNCVCNSCGGLLLTAEEIKERKID